MVTAADNIPYEKVGDTVTPLEVPFEIPESWEWVRLGEIFQHNTGKALNSANRSGERKLYITTSNLYWDKFELDHLKEMYFTDAEIEKCTATKDDLLVCEGGDIGRAAIWEYDYDICIQNHIHRLRAYTTVCTKYFYYLFYLYKHMGWIGGKGIGIQGLSANAIHILLFPLPPLAEQHRIVAKIEELLPIIEKYGDKESELSRLNSTFPEALKKSILQQAVQGKLVPQDPTDEPAEVLLERIRAEKQRLVQESKIKKDKHESVIFRRDNSHYELVDGVERCIDEELPFTIPESWTWVRLGQICKSISDGDHQPPPQVSKGIPFLVISNISNGKINIDCARHVPESYFQKLDSKRIAEKNDILYTVTGSYGIPIIVNTDIPFCFQRHIALLKPLIDVNFLHRILSSPFIKSQADSVATGIAQKTVGIKSLNGMLFPVPPLAEQHRIVAKIEELLPLIQSI